MTIKIQAFISLMLMTSQLTPAAPSIPAGQESWMDRFKTVIAGTQNIGAFFIAALTDEVDEDSSDRLSDSQEIDPTQSTFKRSPTPSNKEDVQARTSSGANPKGNRLPSRKTASPVPTAISAPDKATATQRTPEEDDFDMCHTETTAFFCIDPSTKQD